VGGKGAPDHRADALAFVHQIEGAIRVDLGQRDPWFLE